jgi:non-homologous end joining protein Ku
MLSANGHTIPVKLSVAARSESISFNQIHKPCGSRINQQLVCKTCDRTVVRASAAVGRTARCT